MTSALPDGEDGPIEAATAQLKRWLHDTCGVPVRVAPPADTGPDAVLLWPLELRADQQVRGSGSQRPPFRFGVRYLITACGAKATGLLDRLIVAAADGEPELILSAPDPALWSALGALPRLAICIDVPAEVTRQQPKAPPVRQPLRVHHVGLVTVTGTVVGPGGAVLPNMRVEVIGTSRVSYSDEFGRFTCPGVPAMPRLSLLLTGRGTSMTTEVDPRSDSIVIQCDLTDR